MKLRAQWCARTVRRAIGRQAGGAHLLIEAKASRTSELNLLRGVARFVGVGVLIYLAVLAPDIVAQFDVAEPWWTVLATPTVAAGGVTLLAASWRDGVAIRHASIALAAGYLICAVMFVAARTGETVGLTETPWLAMFPGLPAIALATVVRPLVTVGYLLTAAGMGHFITWELRPGSDGGVLAYLCGVSFGGLFAGAAYAIVRSGRILDRTAAAARAQAQTFAAAESRAEERRRFNALIHDGVMATLLSAGRSENTALIALQARDTTRQLNDLRSGIREHAEVTADELVAKLRAAAATVDDAIMVESVGDRSAEFRVDAEVANALGAAVIEAARNARRHAGAAATCKVIPGFTPRSVRVDIVDDGSGFDPARVPPHRLGLQVSIHGRFESLNGGWSRVDSSIGAGTRVTVGWAAE